MLGYGFAYTATNTPCQPTKRGGTFALGEYLRDEHGLPLVGYYNCRDTAGGSPSRHGVWAAIDAHVHVRGVTDYPKPEEKTVGDAMAAWLVTFAELLGVQRVIWLDRSWTSISRKWGPYTSTFHGNHVHVELCDEASWKLTAADIESLEDDDMASLLTEADVAGIRVRRVFDLYAEIYGVNFEPDAGGLGYWIGKTLELDYWQLRAAMIGAAADGLAKAGVVLNGPALAEVPPA